MTKLFRADAKLACVSFSGRPGVSIVQCSLWDRPKPPLPLRVMNIATRISEGFTILGLAAAHLAQGAWPDRSLWIAVPVVVAAAAVKAVNYRYNHRSITAKFGMPPAENDNQPRQRTGRPDIHRHGPSPRKVNAL